MIAPQAHSLLLPAALVVAGMLACPRPASADCQTTPPPRMIVKVTPYAGAISSNAQDQLSRFIQILQEKSELWKEDFANLASAAPFLTQFDLKLDRNDVMKGQPITADQAYRYWLEFTDTLQVLYGTVFDSPGQVQVQSAMHLGQLEQPNAPTVIRVTLLLEASEFATANDSHSLIVYYALGLEALSLGCPASVTSYLLSHANEKATDLLRRKLGEREHDLVTHIKAKIDGILSTLK